MRTFALWLLALFYTMSETAYFGWNWTPHSEAEIIAEGIACLLFAISILSWRTRP